MQMSVVAAEGRRVRDPFTGLPIPGVLETDREPAVVEWDIYWARREIDGDVIAKPYTPPKAAKAQEPKD